jgi:lipopolysaccharide transport system ATP-binding protein
MEPEVRITVRNLSKRYLLGAQPASSTPHMTELMRRGVASLLGRGKRSVAPQAASSHEFWALRDVNFELRKGERLGIVGRNGAGKSTLLKILARLIHPTEGEVCIRGRVTALLEVGTGFNEALTGRENIFLSATVYGLTREEIAAKFDDIVDFSGIGDFIDEPVKNYSSGMRSRLGFSVAAHLDPDILILDEVLAVGDMAFVQKCMSKIDGLTAGGRTVIFVSHGIGDVVRLCDRALWLEHGRIAMDGPVHRVAEAYASSMMGLKAEAKLVPIPVSVAPAGKTQSQVADPERSAAEITAFRLLDAEGRAKTSFLRQETVRVQLRYRALRADLPLIASVHIHCDGVHVLSTHPPGTMKPVESMEYEATVELPPLFLNKSIYHFSAAVVSPVRPILRHAKLDHAISCSIFDQLNDGDVFSGDYRGVVRPVLNWKVEQRRP